MKSDVENSGRESRNVAIRMMKRGAVAVVFFAFISLYVIFTNDTPERTSHIVLFAVLYANVIILLFGFYYFFIRPDEHKIPKLVFGIHLGGIVGSIIGTYAIVRGLSSSPEIIEFAPVYYSLGLIQVMALIIYWMNIRQQHKKE